MAVKNYMINDKWLDIAKQNIVEVESTDGVIGSVKVNGQEYGGGGDFSVLTVKMSNGTGGAFPIANFMEPPGSNISPDFNIYDWGVELEIDEIRFLEFIIPKNLNLLDYAFAECFSEASDLINCYIEDDYIYITDTSQNASVSLYKD